MLHTQRATATFGNSAFGDAHDSLTALVDAAQALIACETQDRVFEIIDDFFSRLMPNEVVIVNAASPDGLYLVNRSILGVGESCLKRSAEVLGFEATGSRWPIAEPDHYTNSIRSLAKLPGGFRDLVGDLLPRPVASLLEKMLGFRDAYAIAIADQGGSFGNVCIITTAPDTALPTHVIESFVYECVLTLTRLKVSRELVSALEDQRLLVENMGEGLALHEMVFDDDGKPCDYRFLQINPAYERVTGLLGRDIIGKTVLEVTRDLDPALIERFARVAATGIPRTDEDYSPALDRHLRVTAYSPTANQFAVVVSDVTDRKEAEQALQELLEEREAALEQLRQALLSTTDVVSRVAEMRDPYTAGHQRRVAQLALRISEELGMSAEQIEHVRLASLLHDVGKMSIPAEILTKPGKLTDTEFELIKGHAKAGYQILVAANLIGPTAEIVYQHHERCDGSGYPRRLGADGLFLASKVLMVADVVEAMTSHRPYRAGLGIDVALAEIERGAGTSYDAEVSRACVSVFREQGFEFSDG